MKENCGQSANVSYRYMIVLAKEKRMLSYEISGSSPKVKSSNFCEIKFFPL